MPLMGLASTTFAQKQGAPAEMSNGDDMKVHAAYCRNIGDAAEETRAAIRKMYLEELEGKIEKRMEALDKKRAAVEAWMKRREAFLANATKNLIDIYSAMRPDAAAQQISIMDDNTAAAILLRLKPRTASAILNEIEPERAAWLARIIAGSTKTSKKSEDS